jgi:glycosyltransferase involved in cell wall biosynthesis
MSVSMYQSIPASVIVPTHQRAALLPRALDALSCQDFPFDQFEVIVAADACTDQTVQVVQDYSSRAPYRLRVVVHQRRSASATRNFGAEYAKGSTLIFLDDDIEAGPTLVRAHMAAQTQDTVTLGFSKPGVPPTLNQWQLEARLWWEDQYREMRRPGHRFGYRDFFSGNYALPTDLFRRTGGFDVDFSGRLEDYEYGFRLIQSGARFRHVPDAVGLHHDTTDLPKWLRRIREEGFADVQLGTKHPLLRRELFRSTEMPGWRGRVRRLAFVMHRNGDGLLSAGLRIASALERMKLRRRRNFVVHSLRLFNYWRGVAASTVGGSIVAFTEWTQEETNAAVIGAGAPCLEWTTLHKTKRLDELLAEGSRIGIRILIDGMEVLAIPPEPWSEPLRSEHIELALSRTCAEQFVPALASRSIKFPGDCFAETRD